MLTLESGSICDVCADEYGPRNLPHSIPCGHVLCLSCCTSIVEKTSKAPLCPFCREEFSRSSIRKIRIDFPGGSGAGSGFSTPRRSPRSPRAPLVEDDFPHDLLMKVNSAGGMVAGGEDAAERRTQEARRLETRVLRVASQKTSVDEVTTLQRELQDWLGSDKAHSEMSTSLYLSALLLRAIISNHFAFSEASKVAKSTETTLRQRVDDLERDRTRLETEVHKLNHQLQKVRTPPTSPPSTRVSSPTAQVGTTSMPPAPPHPISRLTQGHYRSQSVAPTARSATPAGTPLARSNTPAISSTPSSTSTSPFSSSRSPASSTAGYTSPYATSMSSTQSQSHVPARATTPAPHTYRSTAPTPSPSSTRKVGRTISTTAPPGSIPRSMSVAPSMMGSHHGHSASVGAGAGEHARWIPDPRVAAESSRPLGPRVPVMSRG